MQTTGTFTKSKTFCNILLKTEIWIQNQILDLVHVLLLLHIFALHRCLSKPFFPDYPFPYLYDSWSGSKSIVIFKSLVWNHTKRYNNSVPLGNQTVMIWTSHMTRTSYLTKLETLQRSLVMFHCHIVRSNWAMHKQV